MQEEIPPVTQEYLNRHPELEALGVKVGDPLPDAPQPMIREVIDETKSVAKSEEKINPAELQPLNDRGDMEEIKKSRDGIDIIYTIRTAGKKDEVIKVQAGSDLDKEMQQRMSNSYPVALEEETGEAIEVLDENKRVVRVYTVATHGIEAEAKANQFAAKINGVVRKK